MIAIGLLFIRMLCDCFRPRQQLEAEILVLRHQLNVLRRRAPRRPHLCWGRTRLVDGRSSASATLLRIRSLADYTINTLGSSFRKRQVQHEQA